MALLGLLNLALCILLFDPKVHTGGDSSHYVLLAQSILRSGDGYADSIAPGGPVPHTQYPPGYPLLLAPLVALFGPNIVLLKLLSVALTVGSVLLFSVLVRGRLGERGWLWVALAFALCPVVVDYSHWMLSEAPFLFFTLLALVLLDRARDEEGYGTYFWASMLAIVSAYYVRSIGVTFIAAGTLYYLVTRQWRKTVYYSVVAAALSLPWVIRNQLLAGAATPYLDQFLLRSVYQPEAGYHDVWGMIGRFFTNVWIYSGRELPRVLTGSASPWSAAVLVRGSAVVLTVIALVGFVRTARARLGVGEVYFALSCLAILLFEEVVSDVRYLVPLVPLVLLYVWEGADWLGRRLAGGARAPAAAVMIGLAGLGGASQLARVPQNLDMLARYAGGDPFAGYAPQFRSFFLAMDWIGANTQPDAVVTIRIPRLMHLRNGRRAVLYPYSTDADSVLAAITDTDYVVVDQVSGTTPRDLIPAIQSAPDRFSVVYESPSPPTWVLQVLDTARAGP
jgi:4-amino-4-deoxy-L-arabinose transferase-like glycosyltransferase